MFGNRDTLINTVIGAQALIEKILDMALNDKEGLEKMATEYFKTKNDPAEAARMRLNSVCDIPEPVQSINQARFDASLRLKETWM